MEIIEMDANIVDRISHLLNEEKWTRAAIGSYSVSNFEELDSIIKEIADDETKEEVLKICDEHLAHNKNSIIGLYISGTITLSRNRLDDSNMLQLISLFTDAGKWNVAEMLCNRMLAQGDNKSALKILADCYKEEGQEEKKIATWERIIRVDHEETDITKALAEKYEADGDTEKAISYYKKAILRYSQKKLFTNMKEIWAKLLEIDPDDLDFFHYFLKKISRTIQAEKIAMLMDDLYRHFKANKDWDNAIGMLKEIIALNFKGEEVRKEIIESYTAKYGELPHFQNALNDSNLSQSWRPINDAISDFEKYIDFAKGNFVFHNDWGIGRIKAVNDEVITIDFFNLETGKTQFGQEMAIKMAVNTLSILPKNHIWVIKCTHKLSDLKKMVLDDVAGTLKTIIKSFDNCADLKLIKKELTQKIKNEGILNAKEWTAWSQDAKKELMSNPEFGNILDKKGFYEVRVKPITQEEKLFNVFKNKDNFFDKYSAYQDYLKADAEKNEFYSDMLDYFSNIYRTSGNIEEKVCCWLILEDTDSKPAQSFADFYSQIPDVAAAFNAIPERQKGLRESFLGKIKETVPDWQDIFCSLFPYHLDSFIPDTLIAAGCTDKIKDVFKKILDGFKTYRKPFVWVCEHEDDYPFVKEIMPSQEKILTEMILLLDITNRDIASKNKKNSVDDIKISKQIEQYLFQPLDKKKKDRNDCRIAPFILDAEPKSAKQMLFRLEGVADLDNEIVSYFKRKLREKYPDITFETERPLEVVYNGGLLVTKAGLDKKREELKYILEVEIPKNSKEIGEAIALGDLSENAEYKYGKEKQAMLNAAAGKLTEEINSAQVFDKANLDLKKVSFGTRITLLNMDTNQNVVYNILGPWESNPEMNIISYLAPLADELLGAEIDEVLKFEINDTLYNFKVLAIEASDLL
ncbi:MAG: transcription elongation factor GreA [Spirochaetia bacterium]|nr:transcription elongation factor GreA [Spirochaetia bacterium]